MQTQRKTWDQVGELFETLGKHLRDRADDVSTEAATERAAIEKSLRTVTTALEDVLTSLGKVVSDPQLRKDFTRLIEALRGAVEETYTSATARVRRVVEPARRTTARKPAVTRAPHTTAKPHATAKAHATEKPRKPSAAKPA